MIIQYEFAMKTKMLGICSKAVVVLLLLFPFGKDIVLV